MEPSRLSAVRRGHPRRPRYGQTLVQNGALRAVSRQARAPTETPVRADACTEWSRPGCQPSGDGHRDLGTDKHLYRMEPSGLSAVRRGHPQRPRYGLSAFRRGHSRRPRYGQTLVQNGAVSLQARAPTETPVQTDTCSEWSPPGCEPSCKGTHRDVGTGRRLYRMELSGLSPVRRWPQRPRYGQTFVQNGALRAVSLQARAPTETPVRTGTCTEWSPPGCQLSGEGTHRDPGTDRHLYRMEPSGLSAIRRGHPQRPRYGLSAFRRGHPRRPQYGLSSIRRGHPQRPRYGLSAVRRGLQRPRYGRTLVQNGAVSRQARAPTEIPVRAVSRQAGHPRRPRYGLSAVRRGHPQRPRYGLPTETPVRTDTCTEWTPPGCQLSGEGYRDPGTDRHLYRMEPCGLSAVRRGHPQSPQYGQTLVQNGAL
ncbi:hypothetical protein NDU88_006735 [Pleurodeles waltl]|uniref:Uncharacterized protein n=1 Tax=Pleurodeles waltl TaxID=8319 RepID=A0AAV7L6N6_PLEWA|nr:hypothetical protein NDU88_006735 [Pleurodeles waltl]